MSKRHRLQKNLGVEEKEVALDSDDLEQIAQALPDIEIRDASNPEELQR